ncbi:MAG: hypothetical protein Q8O86_05140 [Dehalococcoidia bacterium]|nr:hypothetical protein [Dehalococcoidia bacterium]
MWVVLLIWILLWDRLGLYKDIAFGWLNINVGVVQAIATVALICVTGYYAWQTKQAVEAAKRQADASVKMAGALLRPIVDLDLPLPRNGLQLIRHAVSAREEILSNDFECVISNLGVGPALDMEVSILHPFQIFNTAYVGALRPSTSAPIHFLLETEGSEGKGASAISSLVATYADVYGNKWKSQRDLVYDFENSRAKLGPLKVSRA